MSGGALRPWTRAGRALGATSIAVPFAACVPSVPIRPADTYTDSIRAAFVVLGEGGVPVVRIVTVASTCPAVDVDGVSQAMTLRAAPATEPLRPTLSIPSPSKPSAFPVLT